jgi:hypothetical protein
LYQSDFHRGLTEFLALLAGFSREEAIAIAEAAVAPDRDRRNPIDTGITLLFPGFYEKWGELASARSLRKWHFPLTCNKRNSKTCAVVESSDAAREVYLEGIAELNLAKFGEGLHVLQDSYSHQGSPTWTYRAPELGVLACFGHPDTRGGAWSTRADRPDRYPDVAFRAAGATFRALMDWQRANGNWTPNQVAAGWEAFSRARPEIEEWIRLPSKGDREEWLAQRGITW